MSHVGEDAIRDAGRDTSQDERMTVAEAAEVLGTSKEAIRKRISRGTLRSEKDADGTVYVYVPYVSGTPSGTEETDRDLLYQEMRDRIGYLERQVEEEREARRRADTLLARLMDRMPELEGPERPAGAPVSPTEGASGTGGPGHAQRPIAAEENDESRSGEARSWWRKLFGG
jgi:excisionase family DNA binding protein